MADMQSGNANAGSVLRQFLTVPVRAQTYKNIVYLLLAFPFGLAYFVGVTVGLSLGAGLLVTLVGVPLLLATIGVVAVIGGIEAKLARRLVDVDAPQPEVLREYDPTQTESSWQGLVGGVKSLLAAPTTWTSLVLVGFKFLYGLVTFVVLVGAVTAVPLMIGAPLLYDLSLVDYQFGTYVLESFPAAVGLSALGVVSLFVAFHLCNGLAKAGGLLTAALLDVGSEGTVEAAE